MGTNNESLGKINKAMKSKVLDFKLIEVNSSRILGIGYIGNDDKSNSGMVVIEFKNPKGSRYIYFNVKRSIFNELKNANSIGKAFGELILDKFEYERVS